MEITFPTDSDGFLSQECPSCGLRFKARFEESGEESKPLSYCPYCGHHGLDCWLTQEQVDYAQAVAASELIAPHLRDLARQLDRSSNSFIKFKLEGNIPDPPPPPMETDDQLDMLHFPCCDETIKVARHPKHFCIICGMEIDMAVSDAKKVFLSHKGVDKERVIDFKKTLELLGYAPWLDEDAMPAGTTLERGILKGMQDSYAVVFFLTPSFKDEGYLESEVNDAVQEKRKKGDKFAIIALQFVDKDGNVGEIPELLKHYVWKKPKTDLEALREIVRALPIATAVVDWRPEIGGVVTAPKIRSTTTTLSDEAKAILQAAASGDGSIMHVKYMGGEALQAGSKSLIPSDDPRVVARWVGGLEDLRRRRYIKDVGHKGEIFEVTREGYEAADELGKVDADASATGPKETP
jgi:hypothetical protein